jgi:hypothetical protein
LKIKLLGVLAAAALLYGGWMSASGEFTDDYGMTGLMRAAAAGDEAQVRRLLSRGARVNRQVPSDDLEAFIAMLGFFQQYPANQVGWTALMFAAAERHAPVAGVLLDEGAEPNLAARDGDTALRVAVQQGAVELVRLLLGKGASPDARAKGPGLSTPLMLCAGLRIENGEESARLLIGAGADVNAAGSDGQTPLILAVRSGNVPVVSLLVGAKADPEARDTKAGWSARMWAMHLANPEVLAALGSTGVTASGADDAEFQLIHAILGRDAAGARDALARGARAQATNEDGEPALFIAARLGQADTVKVLLAAGASASAEYHSGTPLSAAVAGRNADAVRAVLAAQPGAPALQDALRQASIFGQTDIARLLVEGGASGAMGPYPLVQQSVRFGNAELIKLLLDAGADPNLKGEGQTPLAAAVSYGKVDVIRLLLAAGADPGMPDGRGKTPMDFVKQVEALKTPAEDYKAKYREIGKMLEAAKK